MPAVSKVVIGIVASIALVGFSTTTAQVLVPINQSPDCTYDRAAMLALDYRQFDQDPLGGWRGLDLRGCAAQAADLIRDYRQMNRLEYPLLYWHEGQLRAFLEQTEEAIVLFAKSKPGPSEAWDIYVDASIAFLRRNKDALLKARERLLSLPKPAIFNPTDMSGKRLEIPWPPNLHVVNGLVTCFEKTYKEAYGMCRD